MSTGEDADEVEPPRPRARWWADALAAAVLVLALGAMGAARRTPPRASPPALALLALDGLSWPVVTPALDRGLAPNLKRLTAGQRGRVIGTGGMPLGGLWDWVVTSRPPLPEERTATTVVPRPLLWDLAERGGRSAAVLSWPGLGAARFFPPVREELHVVLDTPPFQFSNELLERLGRDRGTAKAAARAVQLHHPDVLVAGFAGPFDPAAAGTAASEAPPSPDYWRFFDRALGEVLDALGPETTVIAIGRGLGRAGLPGAEGIWLARGPGLEPGALAGPVRTTELAATVFALADVPLVIGAANGPSPFVLAARAPRRWTVAR